MTLNFCVFVCVGIIIQSEVERCEHLVGFEFKVILDFALYLLIQRLNSSDDWIEYTGE